VKNSYQVAKKLIYSLPIVPRYDLIVELAQDINRGNFKDISSLDQSEKFWTKWIQRAREILVSRNIII
jgi:hypothetical protein